MSKQYPGWRFVAAMVASCIACDLHAQPSAIPLAGQFDVRASAPTLDPSHLQRKLRQDWPDAVLRISNATGGVAALFREQGALTGPARDEGDIAIARAFLAQHQGVFGLDADAIDALAVIGDSPGGRSGLRMLRVEQRRGGWPVFGSETRFLIDRDGRLWRVFGELLPGLDKHASTPARDTLLSPEAALSRLLGWGGYALDKTRVRAKTRADHDAVELDGPAPLAGPAGARLMWFPRSPGVLVPAWSLTVFLSGNEDWHALVDARSGDLLWRRNMREFASTQQARFSVYVQGDGITPADSPAPQSPSPAVPGAGTQYPSIARTTVNMLDAQRTAFSPNGWIDDCPAAADGCDATRGNNVDACLDRDASSNVCDAGTLDSNGRAIGNPDSGGRNRDFLGAAPRDFVHTPAPSGANPDAGDNPLNPDSQRGALVQAFYTINWFHDRMAAFGFDEASGNFQQLNLLGQGGLAGDRIAADIQNTGSNTGSFSTPADGAGPGRLEISLFTGPTPDRDSALDAGIVLHELTHGMTHRLIGNGSGLLWDVARSMGEGWSDFYALSLLNPTAADATSGRYVFAPWVTYKLGVLNDNYVYGFRRFPYGGDVASNPLTFADLDAVTADESGGIAPSPLNIGASGAMEVHNAGTIWTQVLWDVRARVIADPAGANGDVAVGNEVMLQLVTDALKMTPPNPSLIDGRDALIAADCATNDCRNEASIWQGFAGRGLGYRAIAPLSVMGRFALSHMGVGESVRLPQLDVVDSMLDVSIDDAQDGNGNGHIDPGETVQLAIRLRNPWRRTSRVATAVSASLATTTVGLQVLDANATYADIDAQASVTNAADRYLVRVPESITCGSTMAFQLQVQSSLGLQLIPLQLRIGTAAGVGAPITYSATPGLAIPTSSIDGVDSAMDIVDDREIADLDFRIDHLTHPVSGHLSVMLRAPNGYGSDLIFKRGALMVPNQGGGADFDALVIDDDLPLLASEDLNQSLSTQAPFSGDWLPAFNGPFWDGYRPSPPTPPADIHRDSTGQLSRLDGLSTQGRWYISVANGSATLAGTLAGWSLIVKPREYVCAPYLPGDTVFRDGFETPQ